jgi:hypothetical protein
VRTRRLLALIVLPLALAAVAPAAAHADRAPVLIVRGTGLKWTPAGRHHLYTLMIRVHGKRRIVTVARRTIRPRALPGTRVVYRVRAAFKESGWSNAVVIVYPSPTEEELAVHPKAPPALDTPTPIATTPAEGMVVGLDAGGWGPAAFKDVAGAAKAVRLESRFATESEVGGAADAGVTVASWVFGTGGTIGSIEPASYAAAIVAHFKKYGKGGTFWRGRRDLGGGAVEVLNEPNNYVFWSDPNNYAAYANLLKVVHEALAANFPAAIRPKVLASWDGGEGPSSPFGPSWAALGGLAYCDGVTVHPYAGSRNTNGPLGGRIDVEAAHAASGKPVYITEVGWPTAVGLPATGDSQQWTEAQQAEYVTDFFNWARSTGYVQLAVYFNYVDYGTNTWYGIERKDRSHKPSYAALGRVSEG